MTFTTSLILISGSFAHTIIHTRDHLLAPFHLNSFLGNRANKVHCITYFLKMFDKGNNKNYFHIQSHQENHQKHEKRPDFP